MLQVHHEINQECYIGHNGHYLAPGILRSVLICFIPVVLILPQL